MKSQKEIPLLHINNIGMFCVKVGFFCEKYVGRKYPSSTSIGRETLRDRITRIHALFCAMIGLFCVDLGLFCGNIGLFCVDIGLFCGRNVGSKYPSSTSSGWENLSDRIIHIRVIYIYRFSSVDRQTMPDGFV